MKNPEKVSFFRVFHFLALTYFSPLNRDVSVEAFVFVPRNEAKLPNVPPLVNADVTEF